MWWLRGPYRRALVVATTAMAAIGIVCFVATRIVAFAQLFGIFSDHAGVRITQGEIAAASTDAGAGGNVSRNAVIPKILHQVFHNWHNASDNSSTIPAKWRPMQQTCLDLNSDWEYMLWSTKTSEEFIETNYPWFLPTYKSYKHPVQRVDVVKYFVLRHYGGIYIDLDNGCSANLDPLKYYPAFTTDGGLGALSNNIMGGQRGHPFFILITENLTRWNLNYLLPYVTVMFASGQWFVTAMWEKYHANLSPDGTTIRGLGFADVVEATGPLHRVLMDMRPGADPWVFFTQAAGESWADWDYVLLKVLGDYIGWILFLVVLSFLGLVRLWMRYRARSRSAGGFVKYKELEAQ